MSKRETLLQVYSDCHKDAFGFRPRYDYYKLTDDELQEHLDRFSDMITENILYAEIKEAEAVKVFEKIVADTMKTCSCIRDKAIEFLLDAEEVNGDWGFFCYLNGLPYSYER